MKVTLRDASGQEFHFEGEAGEIVTRLEVFTADPAPRFQATIVTPKLKQMIASLPPVSDLRPLVEIMAGEPVRLHVPLPIPTARWEGPPPRSARR